MPPVILPDASVGAGFGRPQYRRAVGHELKLGYRVLEVAATPSPITTPDAERQILVTALRADQKARERFDGWYVYVANGDQRGETRQVLSGTFDGQIGSLLLDDPFTSPLPKGTEIEVSKTLPPDACLDRLGINQVGVDAGLARCRVEARIARTGNGTRSISLVDLPWIVTPEQIKGTRDRWYGVSSTEPTDWAVRDADVKVDGATLALEPWMTYASAEAFELVVITEGDRLIKTNGSWGYADTTGLPDDDARAAPPVSWVRTIGCAKALEYLIELTEEDETISDRVRASRVARYEQRRRGYAAAGAKIILEQMPRQRSKVREPILGYASYDRGWP